jgi:D-glycero-D-manno-heptose 1,7-bisphosphate phosphatase
LITNQPVIARGEASKSDLQLIHAKLETEVSISGGYFDAIYYCPHHPDKGYPGERLEYKTICDCRKPKVGMIQEAIRTFPTDLSKSMLIGDSEVDQICAQNANLRFTRINRSDGKNGIGVIKSLDRIEFIEEGISVNFN